MTYDKTQVQAAATEAAKRQGLSVWHKNAAIVTVELTYVGGTPAYYRVMTGMSDKSMLLEKVHPKLKWGTKSGSVIQVSGPVGYLRQRKLLP